MLPTGPERTAPRRARRAWTTGLLIGLCVLQTGCGILMQSMMGWKEPRHERQSEPHRVQITSDVEGAEVERIDEKGRSVPLGIVPTEDELQYTTTVTTRVPGVVGLILGASYEAGGAVAAAVAIDDADAKLGVSLTLAALALVDVIALAIHASSDPEVPPSVTTHGPSRARYHATRAGIGDGYAELVVPAESAVHLVLTASAARPWPSPFEPPPPPWRDWVVELRSVEADEGLDAVSVEQSLRAEILDRQIRVTELGDPQTTHHLEVRLSRRAGQCVIEAELDDARAGGLSASAVSEAACADLAALAKSSARRLFGMSPQSPSAGMTP